MNENIDEMDCRCRTDSILMRILRSAMDNAYEKVQSRDGPIECLHERYEFYELALIQIKGCYGLIQKETDSCIMESGREKMLVDLTELQDLFQARLEEMKGSIHEKDYELITRSKSEIKLRHALASKEREMQRLRANIEIERAKSESYRNVILNFQANNGDEAKEEEICELKNSVDKQVLTIKQKLEDERARKSAFSAIDFEIDAIILDEYEDCYFSENKELYTRPEQNIVIVEQMSSDIDILKGTLKIAFKRMQSAEVRPLEEQVKWMIERETTSTVIKGYIRDLKQNVKVSSGFPYEHMLELIEDMTKLRDELETLIIRNENIEKRGQGNYKILGAPLRTSSEPLPDSDYMEELAEEDLADENSNRVAKLVQNHEYFIWRQQGKLPGCNEGLGRRCYSSAERNRSRFTERRIRDVVEKLNNIIKLKDTKWIKIPACLEHEKRKKGISRYYKNVLKVERIRMKEEKCASELQALVVEDTHIILFKGLLEKFYLELCTCENESFITSQHQDLPDIVERSLKVEVDTVLLMEIVKAMKMEKDAYEFQNLIREDIYWFIIARSMKEFLNQCYCSQNMVYNSKPGNSLTSTEQTFCILKCPELNVYLMPKANADSKEENLQPGELDQCGIADSSSGYVTTLSLVSKTLKSSMHQLSTSKELLEDPQCTLGIEIDDLETLHEKEKSLAKSETTQSVLCSSLGIVFSHLIRFQKLLLDFKNTAEQKLQTNDFRLEKLKQKTDLIFQASTVVRKNNFLYKEAFVRRCYNLQLAENEVDLLGDQVDALLGLLHKIYLILDQYSPILSLYFDVSGILKQIKENLNGPQK